MVIHPIINYLYKNAITEYGVTDTMFFTGFGNTKNFDSNTLYPMKRINMQLNPALSIQKQLELLIKGDLYLRAG